MAYDTMNNITNILKSETVNLSITQGRKLEKYLIKIGRTQYSKMEASLSYKFSLSFLEAKAKKEKLFMELIPYERHKQANNKIPKNSVQRFAEAIC